MRKLLPQSEDPADSRARRGSFRSYRMATGLLVLLICTVYCHPFAQEAPAPALASVSGVVTDQDDQPVIAAIVTLEQRNRNRRTQTTDLKGRFTFREAQRGAGSLKVEAQGREPVIKVFASPLGGDFTTMIVLPPPQTRVLDSTPQTAKRPLEFSDAPDFKIAGITDWTAVGGHGSDVTLRTSEDLARATSSSKEARSSQEGPSKPEHLNQQHETELRAALAANPSSYALNHELGELYLSSARYREAVPLLEAASRLNAHAAKDEYALAQACNGVGDLIEARRHINMAIAKQDSAAFRRFSGELEEKLGNPLAAVREEQRAVQLDPSEDNYLSWASELLLHRAIWQASEVLAKGSQLYPQSARIEAALGAALFAGARYDEAAKRLCEASRLDPSSREPYVLLGKAILGSPTPLACATGTLARFLRLKPEDAEANYYDAMQLLKDPGHNDPQQVETLLHNAVVLNPGYADAYLQLGILASANHRNAEALRYFQQAIEADPRQAEAHYRLGVLYDRDGKSVEAQQELHTHEVLEKEQADAIERERRSVKQFLVVPQEDAAGTPTHQLNAPRR